MKFLNPHLQEAWNTVMTRYFHPKTELFYEFTVDEETPAWSHLPTLQDIRNSDPNPCGWGTGMEDSVMNTAITLDTMVEVAPFFLAPFVRTTAVRCLRGLLRCVKSSRDPGFVARSVSPEDGKTHYIESSRDQYTHWVYSALRVYDTNIPDPRQQRGIAKALVKIAEKAKRDVTETNDFHLLREDGTIGCFCKMWGEDLGTHEHLRLPMIYLAAYHVSNDPDWLDLYHKYRDIALERTLPHDPSKMRCFGSLQLQCSLRCLFDYDPDPVFQVKLLGLMRKLARYGEEKALENAEIWTQPDKFDVVHYRFHPWNEVEPLRQGVINGYLYNNPAQSERKDNPAFYPIREICEGIFLATTCPDYPLPKSLSDAVEKVAATIDFKKYSSVYLPLYLCCAHLMCLRHLMTNDITF